MCGIYGIIGRNAKKYKNYLKIFDKLLLHRGPDHGGVFIENNLIVGHRRLSILELSKKSNQPLMSRNKENVIAFNGEVYNFEEILNNIKLKFRCSGDSIALVELLAKYGISSLSKLRGMFAFSYYNKKSKNCFLVRDRFGIKPLYYLKHDNNIFFSSEIKPLLFFNPKRDFNKNIINQYLNNSVLDHSNETFFKNIFQLEPGHYLKINKDGQIIEKVKWYDLKKRPDVIIFEGWCVGAKSEKNNTLKKTINSLEKAKDQKQIWRKYVNQQLKLKYKNLYSQLNCLIYLRAKNFSLLQKWRLKQERKLWIKSISNKMFISCSLH